MTRRDSRSFWRNLIIAVLVSCTAIVTIEIAAVAAISRALDG